MYLLLRFLPLWIQIIPRKLKWRAIAGRPANIPFYSLYYYLLSLLSLAVLQGLWDLSSQTRNRTSVPFIRMWILNHWTAREVPLPVLKLDCQLNSPRNTGSALS